MWCKRGEEGVDCDGNVGKKGLNVMETLAST